MRFVVTGSLGNVSLPVSRTLIAQGHEVVIVSSNPAKADDIRALGGLPAIGSLEDAAFLTRTFAHADGVYCMVPPSEVDDQVAYYGRLGKNYVTAIRACHVPNIVFLSSWGADKTAGTGPILGSHEVEELFRPLGKEASVTHLRATSLMYNLYGFSDMIRHAGFIGTNYGDDDMISWVHPEDVADAAAVALLQPTPSLRIGVHVVYVASHDMTARESAKVIGAAIGKPDLDWKRLPKDLVRENLIGIGMSEKFADQLVDLNESLHNGALAEDYTRHKPVPGKRKLAQFAQEFARRYRDGQ